MHRAFRTLAIGMAMLVGTLGLAGCSSDDVAVGTDPDVTSTTATAEPTSTSLRPPPTPARRATTTSTTTTAVPPTTAPTTTVAPAPPTTPAPPASLGPAQELRRGPTDQRWVALTFDAGSDVGYTTTILDILAREGIPASFGLTGAWTDAHPGLVRRIAADGHLLINHTYDHPSFTGFSTNTAPLPTAQRLDQLRRTDDAIRRATGGTGTQPWFRPAYGDTDAGVLADVGSAGYGWSVMWTVDSLGWRGISASEISQRCLDRAEPGAIYLFHVGSASADAEALPSIIAGLRADGYRFVTVADMVGR